MSQEDILNLLSKRSMTSKEMAELLELTRSSITHSIKRLLKHNEICVDCSSGIPVYYIVKKRKRGKKPQK